MEAHLPDPPTARLLRVFAPARDFDLSRRVYRALGWRELWSEGGLADLELAGARLYLQDYYAKEWAENFMVHVVVDSADAWHAHVARALADGDFSPARVAPPKLEPYGAKVTYVWDPSGVLLHFAEPRTDDAGAP